ncbi:hypothetical protein TRAPUB_12541 [Trametes pubescens]|uniref:Uncharacterized protein n=1 Tax=Trametes pubescens TaxID=154538 RepID=A0A1M2VTS4_TRAPU|nr:hypothetical protein TRAPUB_12541 [Trametes pubescens]
MSTAEAGTSAQQTPTPADQEEDPWTWTWTRDNLAVVSILIKEKKQLREAVRRYEAAEERMEKYKNGPLARQRLDRLLREVNRDGMQPSHVHELREILDEFPEDEA